MIACTLNEMTETGLRHPGALSRRSEEAGETQLAVPQCDATRGFLGRRRLSSRSLERELQSERGIRRVRGKLDARGEGFGPPARRGRMLA